MNIQQLRYVVAIANSGTFREAAEKMYVSQPSLSISIKDLEIELGFQIFSRTSSGTFLTQKGMDFYEKAQNLVKGFDQFEHLYLQPEEGEKTFSISSQHYDFLPPLITEFSRQLWHLDVSKREQTYYLLKFLKLKKLGFFNTLKAIKKIINILFY